MKHLIPIFFFLSSFCYAQQIETIIFNTENNLLYRGYKNPVMFGICGENSAYKIDVENGRLVSDTIENVHPPKIQYFISPTGGGTHTNVYFIDTLTQDTIGIHKFRLANLPAPSLFIENYGNGAKIITELLPTLKRLIIKYPDYLPLQASFKVTAWEINFSREKVTLVRGSGPELTDEALTLINSLQPGDKIEIHAKYKGLGYSGNTLIEVHIQ